MSIQSPIPVLAFPPNHVYVLAEENERLQHKCTYMQGQIDQLTNINNLATNLISHTTCGSASVSRKSILKSRILSFASECHKIILGAADGVVSGSKSVWDKAKKIVSLVIDTFRWLLDNNPITEQQLVFGSSAIMLAITAIVITYGMMYGTPMSPAEQLAFNEMWKNVPGV